MAIQKLTKFICALEKVEIIWKEKHTALNYMHKKRAISHHEGYVYYGNGGIENERLLRKFGSTMRTADEPSKELKIPIIDFVQSKYPELVEHYCLAQVKEASFRQVKHDYFYINSPDDDEDLVRMMFKSKDTVDSLMQAGKHESGIEEIVLQIEEEIIVEATGMSNKQFVELLKRNKPACQALRRAKEEHDIKTVEGLEILICQPSRNRSDG